MGKSEIKLNNVNIDVLRVKYGNASEEKIKKLANDILDEEYLRNNKGFWIKIRNEDDKPDGNADDKIYYNGIKAFEIKYNDGLYIEIAENIFNVNLASLQKLKNSTVDAIYQVRAKMKNYLSMQLNEITINLAPKTYPVYNKKDNRQYIKNVIINNICEEIKSKNLEKYFNMSELNSDKIINHFDKYFTSTGKEDLKKYSKYVLTINKNIDKKSTSYLNDITKIEEIFFRNCVLKGDYIHDKYCGLSKPNFKILFNKKTINGYKEYNDFEEAIREAIVSYNENTGDRGLEKKYQHQFMISNNVLTKFNIDDDLYRFEEEDYTDEGTGTSDKGRVDCIFIGKKTNNIYIIELKVNEDVVDGSNGVQKHLIDIVKLLEKNKDDFIDILEKRYNNRRYALELNHKDVKLKRDKIYFLTIIAFTKKDNLIHKKATAKLLENLNDNHYVINNRATSPKESKEKNLLPPNSKTIDFYREKLKNGINGTVCETEFLYDDVWNREDINKEKFSNEIKIDE